MVDQGHFGHCFLFKHFFQVCSCSEFLTCYLDKDMNDFIYFLKIQFTGQIFVVNVDSGAASYSFGNENVAQSALLPSSLP